jgi:hypothetical protein
MQPAVVVSAFNRPVALRRLLDSLERACYPEGEEIPLIISIDRAEAGPNREVCELASRFKWRSGPKQVRIHEAHLGLVEHFYRCGDLALEYGGAILLEDDLFVSSAYYRFASQALEYYAADERIAGISLFALDFNGFTHLSFIPLPDGTDVFFLQIPYTQGQAFTAEQWQAFRQWAARADQERLHQAPVHEMFDRFPPNEWFPRRTRYLVETGRFYIFPRVSLATGFGDPGAHFAKTSDWFQTPLQLAPSEYRFKSLDASWAVYDSFFEILPERLDLLSPALRGFAYQTDLYATKSQAVLAAQPQAPYVLTTRPCRNPARTFGLRMRPPEANVIHEVPGEGISLCRREDLLRGRLADLAVMRAGYEYFARPRKVGLRLLLQFKLIELLRIWKVQISKESGKYS